MTFFMDELFMPQRPTVDPSPTDREVWVDPLPDEVDLPGWLLAFGDAEEWAIAATVEGPRAVRGAWGACSNGNGLPPPPWGPGLFGGPGLAWPLGVGMGVLKVVRDKVFKYIKKNTNERNF